MKKTVEFGELKQKKIFKIKSIEKIQTNDKSIEKEEVNYTLERKNYLRPSDSLRQR